MRAVVASVSGVLCAAALTLPLSAAGVTIKGEVVDVACATSQGDRGKGGAHADCAMSCARKGQPVGILTSDAVYEVTGDFSAHNNAKLLDFIGKSVMVSGELTERDGKKLLNVQTIKVQ